MVKVSNNSFKALHRRNMDYRKFAKLLNVTERHAEEITSGKVDIDARERAIIRLACNVTPSRLNLIMKEFENDQAWRECARFPSYEVNNEGLVRRLRYEHGSQPGHILKHRASPHGHLYVNLSHKGKKSKVAIHRLVCEAFNGAKPSGHVMVCHKNDVPHDNRPENLYWGTPQLNANDRARNEKRREIDKKLTRMKKGLPCKTQLHVKKDYKKQMLRRLEKTQATGLSVGRGGPPALVQKPAENRNS